MEIFKFFCGLFFSRGSCIRGSRDMITVDRDWSVQAADRILLQKQTVKITNVRQIHPTKLGFSPFYTCIHLHFRPPEAFSHPLYKINR